MVSDDEAMQIACDFANLLESLTTPIMYDPSKKDSAVWIGFPETKIGKLNGALASKIWHLKIQP